MPAMKDLTEVPAAWHLNTVVDAWLHMVWLHVCRYRSEDYQNPLAVIEQRLEGLWIAEPETAKQWLARHERDKPQQTPPGSRQGQLSGALLRYGRAQLEEYAFVEHFTPEGLQLNWGGFNEACWPQLQDECWRLADRLVAAEANAEEEASKAAPLAPEAAGALG